MSELAAIERRSTARQAASTRAIRSSVTGLRGLRDSLVVRFFLPFRPLLKGWLLSLLGWGSVGLILGANFVLNTSMSWSEAIQPGLRDWLPWVIFTPLLFRFVARVPLDRGRWKVALPAHLVCCVATVLACHWWARWMEPPLNFGSRGPERVMESGRRPSPRFGEARGPGGSLPATGGGPRQRPPGLPGGPRGPMPGPPGAFFDIFLIVVMRLPVYLAIVSAAHALLFYRRSQERAASLAQARLEALKMQLQPHFLFNALNAIAELMHKDVEAADQMLAGLGNLLRLTLQSSGEQELPLSRELEFVEGYLAIEQVRFGERLRFQLDAAPETAAALVPAFLLQPMVENSVRHGLASKIGPGSIAIRARREGATLRLSVVDDGVGLPKDGAVREGIGFTNTRARLRELYGEAARLEICEADGVTVEIALPWRTAL